MIGPFQRLVLGRPLPSSEAQHEKLSRSGALGAFGLDALSSVAYGPDEILYVLILAGVAGTALDLPIAPVRRHVRCADCRCDRAGNITFGAREASRSVRRSAAGVSVVTGVVGVVQGGGHAQKEGRGGRTRGGEEDGAASVTLLAQRT